MFHGTTNTKSLKWLDHTMIQYSSRIVVLAPPLTWINDFYDISNIKVIIVDPQFSLAPPLDRRDSLFYLWKINFGKIQSRHLFYFYFKGKIKQERKTLKCDSIIFGKCMSLKNPSLGPRIRLLTRKVPLGGCTPLSPKKVSTD